MRIKKLDTLAFSLTELVIAVALSVILFAGVASFYNAARSVYASGIWSQTLQDAANIVLSKIIAGESEAGIVYRLATSSAYTIANGTAPNALYTCGGNPQAAPCNTANPFSELYFCQNNPQTNPCGVTNLTARWYYLNNTGTAVIYHHPTTGGATVEETIYTAPPAATLTLRFSPAAVTNPNNVAEIDVALNQNNTSGAASTYVLMRNHP